MCLIYYVPDQVWTECVALTTLDSEGRVVKVAAVLCCVVLCCAVLC
jgi:hypothetical protein